MTLLLIAYLGGALTILAPCVLPVIPFVFARVDGSFARSGLPMLAGMAVTFAGVATLGAVGGQWAVEANEYGRLAAIALLALMGVSLLAPTIAARVTQPLVGLGARLMARSHRADAGPDGRPSRLASFGLGVATGFLWAPCAGPILGLILTGAVLTGPSVHTSLLLLAFGAGAATVLGLALVAGGRLLATMKRTLGVGEWFRRGLGAAVLAGVVAIGLGLDTGVLAAVSSGGGVGRLESRLLQWLAPRGAAAAAQEAPQGIPEQALQGASLLAVADRARPPLNLPVEGVAPGFDGAVQWLNSEPLTLESLRGKVVLVDFWTFGCINCRNALPHVREWAAKYKDQGLVVIGVHSPEFAYEKNIANVRRAVGDLGITFPVAIDNRFAVWRAYANNYWPANYFIDAQGRIRFHHFGEGAYEESEQVIRQLLDEAKGAARGA